MRTRAYPLLLIALMGSMDCLTTVIGVLFFGAAELNPLIAGVVNTSLPAFVILKLSTTIFVCLVFIQAEKVLMRTPNKATRAFNYTHKLLKLTYVGIVAFLAIVVANNFIALAGAI